MKILKKIFVILVTTTGISVASIALVTPAHAALQTTSIDCSDSNFTLTGGNGNGLLGCSGAFSGNDTKQTDDILDELSKQFGGNASDWSFDEADKSDSNGNGIFTSNPEDTSGTLTFDSPVTGTFAISLKAANSFSLFGFDGGTTGISSIGFITNGVSTNPNGKPQNLSHASFYQFTSQPSQPVPEPLTILGSGVALGFGAFMKRKMNRTKP